MMLENSIKIELGSSFSLNAGICGLVTFLRHNDAEEGEDYQMAGQCLYVSIDYLKENDIAGMYIDTMAECLGENTKFYRLISIDKKKIDKIYTNGVKNLNETEKKDLNKLYKDFIDKMFGSSYKSAYKLMEDIEGIQPITEDMITDLKKCDDLQEKYNKYNKILELLKQSKVNNMLVYTDLLYTQLKLFFTQYTLKDIDARSDAYRKNYIETLLKDIDSKAKEKYEYCCIECRENISTKGIAKQLKMLVDTTIDIDHKKSYYWNCNTNDVLVCPKCAFVYTFIPFGFALMGSDAVFINDNNSVKNLCNVMHTCKQRNDSDKNQSVRHRVLRTLTTKKIDALSNVKSNIQVVINSSDYSHFKFDVIDKDMVEKLGKGKNYLSYLENKFFIIKDKEGNEIKIWIYDETLDYIYRKQDLYFLLDKLIKIELKKEEKGSLNYLEGLLRLAVIFNGGTEMEDLNKKVNFAFMAGKDLRKSILGDDIKNEDDNSLRGFVYRLVNLSAVGDREQFIDSVIRIYSGFGLSIPSIFKDCYLSDEMFKAISHGFILGLKYVPPEKQNENNKEEN